MAADGFELDAYLARLGLARPPAATVEGLRELHLRHALSIPFENCDVLLRRPIRLERPALFDKLVTRGRGGYCFEQNGLFLAALEALGFQARILLARVLLDGRPSARTHAVVLATVGGRDWLADVGFGGTTLREPIPLAPGEAHRQLDAAFRVRRDEEWGHVLERQGRAGWQDQYAVLLERVLPADLAVGNHYTSTSPDTHFTQRFACARLTERGRVTLSALTFSRHVDGAVEQRELSRGPELRDALERALGIAVDEGFAALYREGGPLPRG